MTSRTNRAGMVCWLFAAYLASIVLAECEHKINNLHATYDFTALAANGQYSIPWELGGTIKFGFCRELPQQCQDTFVVAATFPSGSSECSHGFGSLNAVNVATLPDASADDGVQVTYVSSTICPGTTNSKTRIQYNAICDEKAKDSITHASSSFEDQCTAVVSFRSAAACPHYSSFLERLSGGWIFVIILTVVGLVYVLVGIAYKRLRKGASGTEILPNIDFWRRFFSNVGLGARSIWNYFRGKKTSHYTQEGLYDEYTGEPIA